MGLDHFLYYNNIRVIEWRKQYWIVEVLNKLGNLKKCEDEDDSQYTFGLVEFYAFRDFCKLCLDYPKLREIISITGTTHNAPISLDELKRTVIILDDFVRFAHPTHDGEFTHILYW